MYSKDDDFALENVNLPFLDWDSSVLYLVSFIFLNLFASPKR